MIWIIAGTSEGREIISRIKDLDNFIATIATDGGKEFIPTDKLIVGRMSYDEMIIFAKEHGISMIVDLTHPYAKIVSSNAKKLSQELDMKYIRYVRDKVDTISNSIYLKSYEESYEYLSKIKGTVFFTTGSKNVKDYEKIKKDNRFIYRILPAIDSIEECRKYNVSMKDTVAVLGPFSKRYNKVMLEEYKADYCVMKDSGDKGGTMEKIEACEELGVKAIVIGREDEIGINNLDDIEKVIRKEI
jgi:precorrin-6A/cobalt-precorrin-6A reductase